MDCIMLLTCASCVIGWVKRFTYWTKETISPT